MLDVGWTELLLIGIVALIVVGPKDLPHLFHALGRFTAKARGMAREFSSAMEDAAKGSGLDEAAKSLREVKSMTSKKSLGLDALDRAADRFEKWDPKRPTPRKSALPDPAAPESPTSDSPAPDSATGKTAATLAASATADAAGSGAASKAPAGPAAPGAVSASATASSASATAGPPASAHPASAHPAPAHPASATQGAATMASASPARRLHAVRRSDMKDD